MVTCESVEKSIAEEVANDNEPLESISTLEILQIIKDAQQQHGLRHGDYQRYHSYCSRRLRRIRKSLHFVMAGYKNKFSQKKVTADKLTDVKFLHIPLMCAERAWSYAMQLKQEANTEPRKRFHLIARLRKAVKHAADLEKLCDSDKCDARTKLEAQAYAALIQGTLQFELEDWTGANESFMKAKTIYDKLAPTLSDEQRMIYESKAEEIIPNIRYCAYNIGDQSAMDDLLQMRRQQGGTAALDMRTDNIEKLIQQTRERQASRLSEVMWRGHTLPVRHEQVRLFLLNVDESRKEIECSDTDGQLALYERLLVECKDAIQAVRDELRTDAKSKEKKAEGKLSSLQLLESYLKYMKCDETVKRNLVLIKMLKAKLPAADAAPVGAATSDQMQGDRDGVKKLTKPQDLIRLYDGVIQTLSDIPCLPGLEQDDVMNQTVQAKIKAYKAFRCYYIALAYYQTKKYPESIALCDRVLEHCELANTALKQLPAENQHEYKDMLSDIHALSDCSERTKSSAHAASIVDVASGSTASVTAITSKPSTALSQKNNKPLIDRLEEYYENPALLTKKPNLVTFPPDFQPIPCKPLFFDLALNSIEIPSLEHRMEQKKAGGITGFVKGWLWGSKK